MLPPWIYRISSSCNQQRALAIILQHNPTPKTQTTTSSAWLNTAHITHQKILQTFCHVAGNLIFTESWMTHFHTIRRLQILGKFNIHNFLYNQHIISHIIRQQKSGSFESNILPTWSNCLCLSCSRLHYTLLAREPTNGSSKLPNWNCLYMVPAGWSVGQLAAKL